MNNLIIKVREPNWFYNVLGIAVYGWLLWLIITY